MTIGFSGCRLPVRETDDIDGGDIQYNRKRIKSLKLWSESVRLTPFAYPHTKI